MNIDTMKAGREMDALVAEKVMGCSALVRKDYSWKLSGGDIDGFSGTVWFCKCAGMHNAQSGDGLIKSYSTNLAAAWDIMDHLIDLHPAIMWENCEWECCLDDHNKGHGEQFWGYADTAPLAICRAALKAVEGK